MTRAKKPAKRGGRARAAKGISKSDTEKAALELRWVEKNKRIKRIDALINDGWATQQIVRVIVDETKVAERTAYDDVREALVRRAPVEAAAATTLKEFAAQKWERRQYICEKQGRQQDANYALDKWCKVMGAYAPKKVELSGSVGVGVAMQMRAVMSVLDATGVAAFEIVMAQVEAAKARGELPPAEPLVPPESEPSGP